MKNESMALLYSGIIYTITTVLTPVIYVVNLFSWSFMPVYSGLNQEADRL